MKIEVLKQDIKKLAISKGIIAAVLCVFLWASDYYNSSSTETLTNIQNSFAGMDSALSNKIMIYDEAEKNLKRYLDIPASKIPSTERYNLGFVRLRTLVPEIDKLKSLYFFKTLDYTVADIKPNEFFNGAGLEAYENNILINFTGASDELVFSLINDLKKILPGYILMESMEVIKVQPVDELNANNYLTRQDFVFVNGKIELKWVIVQKIAPQEQPPLPQ